MCTCFRWIVWFSGENAVDGFWMTSPPEKRKMCDTEEVWSPLALDLVVVGLWMGIWGLTDTFIEYIEANVPMRFLIYACMTLLSIGLLMFTHRAKQQHTQKKA